MGNAYIITLVLLSICFTIGMFCFSKVTMPFKILTVYIGTTLVAEAISDILAKTIHNNMPVYHVFAPVEYLLYTLIYRQLFTGKLKSIITYAIIPVVLLSLLNSIFLQKLTMFPSNFVLFYQVIFLIYSLLGFRQLLIAPSKFPLYRQSLFWLNISLMVFSTTLFLYFGLINYSLRHQLNIVPVFVFAFIVNIIYNILLTVSILVDSYKPKAVQLNESF